MAAPWRCSICLVFLCLNLRALLNHINVSHAGSPNFFINCGIDGCPRNYRRYHSLYKHVVSHHKDRYLERPIILPEPPEINNTGQVAAEEPQQPNAEDVAPDILHGNDDQAPPVDTRAEIDLKTCAAKFICSLKEGNSLTQAATDDILGSTTNFISVIIDKFKKEILTKAAAQMEGDNVQTLRQIVHESELEVVEPFKNLNSSYLQHTFMERVFLTVKLREIKLGETIVSKRKGRKYQVVSRNDTFVYVPLLQSIRQLLSNTRIQALLTSVPKTAPDDYYFDMFDGEIFQNHDLLADDTLALVLYFDEVDICNPIGSHSGVHKLGMFYYSIVNMNTKFRSKLEAVQLLAIARSDVIKKYGINAILEPFVHDLQVLSQGCDFEFADKEVIHLKGALLAAVADTPASHALGGFKESVGASFSKCRNCKCSYEDMSQHFSADFFQKRNLNSHLEQLAEIERANTDYMKNHLRTMYGINRRSILLEAPGFNVCTMLPQDIMHVITEGVAQYKVKEVIKELVTRQKLFGLNQLNTYVKNFHLPYFDVKNKPSEIIPATLASDDSRLRQSASQIPVFLKILPFFLATVLERDNSLYIFISTLLCIINILQSPVISSGSLVYLKTLIKNHLEAFVQLFPENTVIPKQHFMIHFPEMIKRYGPPIRYSCMRYEAKHKKFKQLARNQNFSNLSKSLAGCYLKADCMSSLNENPSSHPLFSTEEVIGPCKQHLDDLQDVICKINNFYEDLQIKVVHSTKHVILCGTKYIPDECVLAVEAQNNLPCFGLLKTIYVVETDEGEQTIFFALKMYETSHFDDLVQAYVIEEPAMPEGLVIKKPRDLMDFACYFLVNFRNEMYISLNYDMMSIIELANEGYPNFLQT